ncbi:thioesterase family protein [Breoghania sp.]|uniref:acyl-CoA thioesterase n=1 Tax=Breoghania sp. TaxID=2065378 RepID=UPI002626F52A|nr:thioesterase family protein [Breoghania sp.]MDJ0931428.1 thioesterase family protein [Breoghania sp.]
MTEGADSLTAETARDCASGVNADREPGEHARKCYATTDKIRYGDTDRQGHVNNAVFSTFLETGRAEILYAEEARRHCQGASFVIATLTLEYLSPLFWPGTVTIETIVMRVGTSSIELSQRILQDGTHAASGRTVIVQVDDATEKGKPLSDEMKAFLKQYQT